jgi:hypothetical protein
MRLGRFNLTALASALTIKLHRILNVTLQVGFLEIVRSVP